MKIVDLFMEILQRIFGKEDNYIKAKKIAENFVKQKTGIEPTYIEQKGNTRIFTDKNGNAITFFAFSISIFESSKIIPYLVIILKKKHGRFEIFDVMDKPTNDILNDFFDINPTWSLVIRKLKLENIFGAPVEFPENFLWKEVWK